ncbi:MAG: UvrD-helicase domain-containing protein, partial [bacterium]
MRFYADLHLHSHYSRATSPQLNLEYLSKWAQLKGVTVVGTGDFVHPGWLEELRQKLEPAEPGLFKLKAEFTRASQPEVPASCAAEVRFMLTAEISNIYKRLDKVRKIHNIVFTPSFEAALKLQGRLEAIGNIRADGRPILGLDSRDLLEIVLETDPLSFLVPAHIWTPWFAVLGSKGGFDAIDDCFADLTPHIFAVETGLSSDPPMNWRLKQLDRFVLISNSDAHSPQKLAREANLFDTELSYLAMYRGWKEIEDNAFLGTIEFFPEEGKYHFDGHRACQTRMPPQETIRLNGNCPICGKPVTVGVMARVEQLADRKAGEHSPRWRPYTNLIPLPEVIAEVLGQGVNTKNVIEKLEGLLKKHGNELHILQDASLEELEKYHGPMLAEGLRRMRSGAVNIAAGYDGEYGTIKLFTPDERKEWQRRFGAVEMDFESDRTDASPVGSEPGRAVKNTASRSRKNVPAKNEFDLPAPEIVTVKHLPYLPPTPVPVAIGEAVKEYRSGPAAPMRLSASQRHAVEHAPSHLLIVAGPGTGKTHTIVHRIAHFVQQGVPADSIMAITFTNKAAEEMQSRLQEEFGSTASRITAGTFHSYCLSLLRPRQELSDYEIAGEDRQKELAKETWPHASTAERQTWLEEISLLKATMATPQDAKARQRMEHYQTALRRARLWDYDDLLLSAIDLIEGDAEVRRDVHQRYQLIFVDEYQDLNPAQHRLLKLLVHRHARLTAIGDPNQAIYGFRGSEAGFFTRFGEDFAGAVEMRLAENYRSGANILSASGQVIESNDERFALPLAATLLSPGRVTIYAAPTDKAEAEYVVHQVERLVGGTSMFSKDSGRINNEHEGERSFGDFAILYRLNTLRRPLEEALQRSGMPYQISGDTPLSQRRGVPALVAVLRVIAGLPAQPKHLAECLMLLTPEFGETSAEKAAEYFRNAGTIDLAAILLLPQALSFRAVQAQNLKNALLGLRKMAESCHAYGLAKALEEFLAQPITKALFARDQILKENWHRVYRLSLRQQSIRSFCDALALQNEMDHFEKHAEKIALMTLHASKGLEFPVVFIVGCEESLTPMDLENLVGDPAEERRLFYVGMTRAKEQLYLLRAHKRRLFGKTLQNSPSRFLADIEEQL